MERQTSDHLSFAGNFVELGGSRRSKNGVEDLLGLYVGDLRQLVTLASADSCLFLKLTHLIQKHGSIRRGWRRRSRRRLRGGSPASTRRAERGAGRTAVRVAGVLLVVRRVLSRGRRCVINGRSFDGLCRFSGFGGSKVGLIALSGLRTRVNHDARRGALRHWREVI